MHYSTCRAMQIASNCNIYLYLDSLSTDTKLSTGRSVLQRPISICGSMLNQDFSVLNWYIQADSAPV